MKISRFISSSESERILMLWSNQVEAWLPGGKSDLNLALERVDIDSVELWETDITIAGRLKMLFGGTI